MNKVELCWECSAENCRTVDHKDNSECRGTAQDVEDWVPTEQDGSSWKSWDSRQVALKAPAPDKKPGKGARRPGSPKWPLVLLLICLIIIVFLLALLIRYWTRGPKTIHTTPYGKNTSTEVVTTTPLTNETVHTETEGSTDEVTRTSEAEATENPSSSEETSESTTPPPDDSTTPTDPQDPTIPKKFPPGTASSYTGDGLPTGRKPKKYSINITLNGNTAGSTRVSGVVDVRLQSETTTKQVVLTADPETIKEFSLALFEDVETPTGGAITAVTPITAKNFFDVDLGEEIAGGKTYRLVMAYEYSAPPSRFSPFMSPSVGNAEAYIKGLRNAKLLGLVYTKEQVEKEVDEVAESYGVTVNTDPNSKFNLAKKELVVNDTTHPIMTAPEIRQWIYS